LLDLVPELAGEKKLVDPPDTMLQYVQSGLLECLMMDQNEIFEDDPQSRLCATGTREFPRRVLSRCSSVAWTHWTSRVVRCSTMWCFAGRHPKFHPGWLAWLRQHATARVLFQLLATAWPDEDVLRSLGKLPPVELAAVLQTDFFRESRTQMCQDMSGRLSSVRRRCLSTSNQFRGHRPSSSCGRA
jgi:hypothetical protein